MGSKDKIRKIKQRQQDKELAEFIDELRVPLSVREDLKKKYLKGVKNE